MIKGAKEIRIDASCQIIFNDADNCGREFTQDCVIRWITELGHGDGVAEGKSVVRYRYADVFEVFRVGELESSGSGGDSVCGSDCVIDSEAPGAGSCD